jgi:hypothetical protein
MGWGGRYRRTFTKGVRVHHELKRKGVTLQLL